MSETVLQNGTVLDDTTILAGSIDDLDSTGAIVTVEGTLLNDGSLLAYVGTLDFASNSPVFDNNGLFFEEVPIEQTDETSASDGPTLFNQGTLEAAGLIGLSNAGSLAIINEAGGTIESSPFGTATIDTGTTPLINDGLITVGSTYEYSYYYNGDISYEGNTAIASTIDNNGGTIAGAITLLAGADIVGGLLGGGYEHVTGAATLDGSATPITLGTYDTVTVEDGASLSLLGTIDLTVGYYNASLVLDSTGHNTSLILATPTVTLTGGGNLSLSNEAVNAIYDPTGAGTLINEDVITGSGIIEQSGAGVLTLENTATGTIVANNASALTIETGGPVFTNAGLLLATGAGGIDLFSTPLDIEATGTIVAAADSQISSDSSLVNDVGGTLTDGLWMAGTLTNGYYTPNEVFAQPTVAGDATLDFQGGAPITVDAATIVLDGVGSAFEVGGEAIENSLTEIAAGSSLSLRDQRGIDFSHAVSVAVGGSIDLEGGILASPALNLVGGAQLTGYGTLDAVITAAGLIESTSGQLTLQNGGDIVGGTIEAGAGNQINIAANTTLDGSSSPVVIDPMTLLNLNPGQTLTLLGTIDLLGTLQAASSSVDSDMILASPTVMLDGGGTLNLNINGFPGADRVYGASAADGTLVNDDLIQGSGQFGLSAANPLTLINAVDGTIDANYDFNPLTLQGATVTNAGLIEANGFDSAVAFASAVFDNEQTGTLEAGPNNSITFDAASSATNLAGGTLAGGTWIVDSDANGDPSSLIFAGGSPITTDAATIVLDFSQSTLSAGGVGLEQSLGSIAAGGTLSLLDGRGAVFASPLAVEAGGSIILAGGTLAAPQLALVAGSALSGFGALAGSVTDDGVITVTGGTLATGPEFLGGGTVEIAANSTAELDDAFPGAIVFVTGTTSTLALEAPQDAPGVIDGLAAGDTIDFLNTAVTAAILVGSTLDVTAGGTTYDFALAASLVDSGTTITPDSSGSGNDVIITVARPGLAVPDVTTPIDIGNFRVGTEGTTAVVVENAGTSGGDALSATVVGFTGVTASGSVTGLAPGAVNDTGITVGLTSQSAGAATGSVTLGFASTPDGGTASNLPQEMFTVTGDAIGLAEGTVTAPEDGLVAYTFGNTLIIPVTVDNIAPANGLYEDLVATAVGGYDSDGTLEAAGTTGLIAPGQSDSTDIDVPVTDGLQAGTVSTNVMLDLQSVGTGIDGAAPYDLGDVTVPIHLTVLNPAYPTISPVQGAPAQAYGNNGDIYLDFGTHPQSDTSISADLVVTNQAGTPSDALSGLFSGVAQGPFSESGPLTVAGLAAGQSAPGADINFDLGTVGTFFGTYVFTPSPPPGAPLGLEYPITLSVTGTVDASQTLAIAQLNTPSPIAFGAVHAGDSDSQVLSITNAAQSFLSPPAEGLNATISTSGNIYTLGSNEILGLQPGTTDDTTFQVVLNTNQAGPADGMATLDFESAGTLNQYGVGDNTTPLNDATLAVTGTVYALASAEVTTSPTILHVGDDDVTQYLTIMNDSGQGAYSEGLIVSADGVDGSITSATGTSGLIADGDQDTGSISYDVSTDQGGDVMGDVTLDVTSDGDGTSGLGDTPEQADIVPIYTQVNNYATATIVNEGNLGTLSGSGSEYTLDLGTIALNSGAATVQLGVMNAGSAYQSDNLDGQFTLVDGDDDVSFTGGTVSGLGGSDTEGGYVLTVDPTDAGTFDATLQLTSTSDNDDSSTPLPDVTVEVTGTIADLAIAQVNPAGSIDFGAVRQGDTVTPQTVTISNVQPDPAQLLDATVTGDGVTIDGGTSSTLNGIMSGGTPGTVSVSLDTSPPAGVVSDSVNFDFESDDGQGNLTPLTSQDTPLNVFGTIYAEASGTVTSPPPVYFHVGDDGGSNMAAGTLMVSNNAPSPYAELLDATAVGSSGGIGLGSVTSVGSIAQGASSPLAYTVDTSTAGTVAGTIDIDFVSDGTGTDNAGTVDLGTQAIPVNAIVDNYASVGVMASGGTLTQTGTNSYDLYLGSASLGDSPLLGNLSILNSATGQADTLDGTWSVQSTTLDDGTTLDDVGFVNALSPVATLAVGASPISQMISLTTASPGVQSETLIFTPTSQNPNSNSTLSPVTITVDGEIGNMSPPATPTPTQPGASPLPNPPPTATAPPSPPAAPPTVPPAQPSLVTPTINFGVVRVGEGTSDMVQKSVTLTNTAASGAAGLNATVSNVNVDNVSVQGTITNLAPAQTDSSDVTVNLDTDTAGVDNGSFELDYTSSTSGLTTTTSVVNFNSSVAEGGTSFTDPLFSVSSGELDASVPGYFIIPFGVSGSLSAQASLAAVASLTIDSGSAGLSDLVSIAVSDPTNVTAGQSFTVNTGVTGNSDASLNPTLPNITESVNLVGSLSATGSLNYFNPLTLSTETASVSASQTGTVPLLSGSTGLSLSFNIPGGGSITVAVPTGYSSTLLNQQNGVNTPSAVSGLQNIVQNAETAPVINVVSPNLLSFIPTIGPFLSLSVPNTGAVGSIASYTLASLNVNGGVALASQTTFDPTELQVTLTPSWDAMPQTHDVGVPFTFAAPSDPGTATLTASYSLTGTYVTQYGIASNFGATFTALAVSLAAGTINLGPVLTTSVNGDPFGPAFLTNNTPGTITVTASGTTSNGVSSQVNPSYTINVVSGGGSGSVSGGGASPPASSPLDIVPVSATVDNLADPVVQGDTGVSGSGTNYTVNLGSTTTGSSLSDNLSVLNAAVGPADLLTGYWSVDSTFANSDSVFSQSFASPTLVHFGNSGETASISATSNAPGIFEEVLTFTPSSNNADENPLSLPVDQVTVLAAFSPPPPPPPPPPVVVPVTPVPPSPPPSPPPMRTAGGGGDPHLTSFDGVRFDFQVSGEFVLSENADFQLQARIEPSGGAADPQGSVAYFEAIAFTLGPNDKATIDSTLAQPLSVDGTAVDLLPGQFITVDGDKIAATNGGYTITYSTGEVITYGGGSVVVSVPNSHASGTKGVLGPDNTNTALAFTLPDGTVLQQPLTFDQLYQTFANAWRVTQATSLFNYAPGESTASYTNTSFPPAPVTIANLPSPLVAEAQTALAGTTFATTQQQANAELDYILGGGNLALAQSDNNAALAGTTSQTVTNGPPPNLYGITPAEPDAGVGMAASSVAFEVFRTGSDVDSVVLNWNVVDTGSIQSVEATDYANGVLPSGQVTLQAGSTVAGFSVLTPAGLRLPTEMMDLQISSPPADDLSYASANATVTLNADTPIEGVDAVPTLYLANGIGTLTGSGTNYTLELGNIGADGVPATTIAVQNSTPSYGNQLGVTFNDSGPFTDGTPQISALAGGNAASFTVDAGSAVGAEIGTVVLNPTNSNSSGFSDVLPAITLTTLAYVTVPTATPLAVPAEVSVIGRPGELMTPAITFGNTSIAGSDNLAVSVTDVGGHVIAPDTTSITPGATITSTLSDNATGPGDFTDTLNVGYVSFAPGATMGTPLPAATITLDGTNYVTAAPVLSASTIDFGTVHEGDAAPTENVVVANNAPASAYSDDVLASLGTIGPFSGNGQIDVAAGSDGSLAITLSTASAGLFDESATVSLTSHDTALADEGLEGQQVVLEGTVIGDALPVFEYVDGPGSLYQTGTDAYNFDLGTIAMGSSAVTAAFALANAATGLADSYTGTVAAGGTTLGTVGTLAPGATSSPFELSFDTSTPGEFSETVTLTPVDSVEGNLQPETLVVSGDVACYCRGTRILTIRGEVAVEDLRVGDLVATFAGSGSPLKPVRWLGHRRIDLRRSSQPENTDPVRFRAGAFGDGLPHRDLMVSPGHRMRVGDVLVTAVELVNGASIVQESPNEAEYWHIELDGHDLVLAEGVQAETYQDVGNRAAFENGNVIAFEPVLDWDVPQPCRPYAGASTAVRAELIARAQMLGWAQTVDPMPWLEADGHHIQPTRRGMRCRFLLPGGCTQVTLHSRSGRPWDVNEHSGDRRRLGLKLHHIALEGPGSVRVVALDSPHLTNGFNRVEAEESGHSWRWTTGKAVLPLADLAPGKVITVLEIAYDQALPMWVKPEADRASQPARTPAADGAA